MIDSEKNRLCKDNIKGPRKKVFDKMLLSEENSRKKIASLLLDYNICRRSGDFSTYFDRSRYSEGQSNRENAMNIAR